MRQAICYAVAALAGLTDAKAIIGTNIGGWQVLEPWITPSLFYRFLGNTQEDGIGVDQYTFCKQLGPEEGNQVLRAHWDSWVSEDDIKGLADREVEIVRLPIGDWTLKPYGPYVGCTDGAADKIQWFLDTAAKYGIKVLLDVHCLKDSQNGFDNSGMAHNFEWVDDNNFRHWEVQAADWIGDWNSEKQQYDNINHDNINWALDNVSKLLEKWGNHPAVYALEPVNEPWENTPRDALMQFYRDARNLIRDFNPDLYFVFQNAFDFSDSWNSMLPDDDLDHVIMDAHYYQAWTPLPQRTWKAYCNAYKDTLKTARETIKYDIWVGEWSLATDVCAMWLGGFNDNNTPLYYECQYVDCPYSYLPEEHAVDFDRTAAELGPFGSNKRSIIKEGKCPLDSAHFDDDAVFNLGQCAIEAFDDNVAGHFLWTFRNELEPRWNYVKAYDAGWIKHQEETKFLQN